MHFNMPVELNYNRISKRFDFGVPLEDIFAQDDIHPRLKLIFQQALDLYLESDLNIEDILNDQPCLQECLELKESIIYDKKPSIHTDKPIGAYFWVIRHFLGLLPIPLLPSSTSSNKYPWQELSRKCRNVIKSKFRSSDQINFLNYSICRALNNLPKEHILLLNTIAVFIREVTRKKFKKTIFKSLIVYYCDAVFIRPFTPGHRVRDDEMLPLMIYLVNKWCQIQKYLRTDYFPLVSVVMSYTGLDREKNSAINTYTQTGKCKSDILYFNKNIGSSSMIVKYLKDAECQTDCNSEEKLNFSTTEESVSTMTQNEMHKAFKISMIPDDINLSDISTYKDQIYLKNLNSSLKLRKLSSFVSSLCDITEEENNENKNGKKLVVKKHEENANKSFECEKQLYQSQNESEQYEEENSKFNTVYEECNTFNTTGTNNDQDIKWNDVVAEIQRTVKRVENYNYEDELYISALGYRSVSSSPPIESNYSSGSSKTNYTSFGASPMNANINETQKSNGKDHETQKKDLHTSMYLSFYSSDDELYNLNDMDSDCEAEEDSVSNFSLKKLIFNFKFLKSISPKLKRSRNVFRNIATKNVKYKRFKS